MTFIMSRLRNKDAGTWLLGSGWICRKCRQLLDAMQKSWALQNLQELHRLQSRLHCHWCKKKGGGNSDREIGRKYLILALAAELSNLLSYSYLFSWAKQSNNQSNCPVWIKKLKVLSPLGAVTKVLVIEVSRHSPQRCLYSFLFFKIVWVWGYVFSSTAENGYALPNMPLDYKTIDDLCSNTQAAELMAPRNV